MNLDDQAFLNQIEQNIRSKKDEVDSARKEAEQRALEMERIRKASANLPGAKTKVPDSRNVTKTPTAKSNPLADDPRYKEYFARLNRQKGIPGDPPQSNAVPGEPSKSESSLVGPGAIVRFDDGSIGIYKDAVSGRDYALFYFLQLDNQFMPQGVFLRCFQAKVIGNLPEKYFSDLRERGEWNRDLIVFHLSQYEHVSFLDGLCEHEERKPRHTTPIKNESVSSEQKNAEPEAEIKDSNQQLHDRVDHQQENDETRPVEQNQNRGLVKGREFKIKFGGKMWEAVFWTEDEQGAIVAHKTHGDWALMRLDMGRFSDSLELGDIVDSDTLEKISSNAASV